MEQQLQNFSKNSDKTLVENYVSTLDVETICSEISDICKKEDAVTLLQTLFFGLRNSIACQNKRFKILENILSEVEKKAISPRACDKLMNGVLAEMDNLTTHQLIKLVGHCLDLIQTQCESTSWKDLLPRLLNLICEKNEVEHEGSRMTGNEYKSEIMRSLCMMRWKQTIIPSMAAMFIDIPLTNEEHLRVVNKLCSYIPNLSQNEIPSLTYQVLCLTKSQNCMPLFVALQEYFNTNLYANISESTEENADVSRIEGVQGVEATVLYHVYSAATNFGCLGLKDLLKNLKESFSRPEFVLQPFYVTLLLSVSCVSHTLEEEVSSILTSAIVRLTSEKEKALESEWMHSVVPGQLNIDSLLDKIIANCARGRNRVVKGLVALGFSLLNVRQSARGVQCQEIWCLGSSILVKLVKQFKDITVTVLQTLTNQISQMTEMIQYTDCLTLMAARSPLNVVDCSSILVQLLHNICGRLPGNTSHMVLAAILPLAKMSHSLRDNLIIVLRKSLFSQDVSGRTVAVFGFLELLKGLKISDLRSLSQSISQSYCGFTQMYSSSYHGPGASYSNEGLCLEVLAILKEVFKHQAEVKLVLYRGLYDAVCKNPELDCHVLDNLQTHFDCFYRQDDEVPPLEFDNVVSVKNEEAVVVEPLPDLVLAMSLIIAKTCQDSSTRGIKLQGMLESLCKRMAEADVPHFGLEQEDGSSLLDTTPECMMKQERIRQILGVYEALMGYTLVTWDIPRSDLHGQALAGLFKGYSRLLDFTRGLTRPGKKKEGEKGKGGGGLKSTFKLSPTVLNLKCSARLLSLLNGSELDWATDSSLVGVKGKRELHRYSMHVALTLIRQTHSLTVTQLATHPSTMGYLSHIGRILYQQFLRKLPEQREFDTPTMVAALECFSELLSLAVTHFRQKLTNFLSDIAQVLEDTDLQVPIKFMIDTLLDNLEELLSLEEDGAAEGDDQHIKKAAVMTINMVSLLVQQMPRGGSYLQQIFDRLDNVCKEKKVEQPQVAKPLVTLLLAVHSKVKSCRKLPLQLAYSLCDVIQFIEDMDDEVQVEEHTRYLVVNEKTANVCLAAICDSLRLSLVEVEWVVARFRAELAGLAYTSSECIETRREQLRERERELCRNVNLSVKVLSILCTLAVPPGTHADAVLRELGYMYSKLTLVTKYFITRVSKYHEPLHTSRFEKTVKLVDSELSKNMYFFTQHVIADGAGSMQDDKPRSKVNPTALKQKVLKETKIIPRVIYEKEQLSKFILQLSNKAKVDLAAQTNHTKARDYRLYTKQMKDILEKENVQLEEEDTDPTDNEAVSQTAHASQAPASKRFKSQ